MSSDEELLARWRCDDTEAGRALLLRYFEGLSRFFRSKVDDGVDELIQRTMLVCLEQADKLRNAQSFRAYLYAIARNEVYRAFRTRMRAPADIDALTVSLHDIDPSPSSMVAHHQQQRLLLAAMRRLPLDYQVTLELYYWEGLSYAELGEVLGIQRETVKSRLKRSKEMLRDHMQRLEDAGPVLDGTLDRFEHWVRSIREVAGVDDEGPSEDEPSR